MVIKEALYERQPDCFFVLVCYSFLVYVIAFVWFENKVPSFSHLDTKDGKFSRFIVSFEFLLD
jgi:hypothetical protein